MIYSFLKRITSIAIFVFFKKIVVSGKELIPNKGPLILVANHPNTFMDPLIITSICNQRIGFIANGGIFVNHFINKILAFLHIIPIYRKQDRAPDEKQDNSKTFEQCHNYLKKRGTILIFPEGTSYYELNLREIKTGTARIALSFEHLKEFKGKLQVIPIALDYSDALQFRSVVSVSVGNPIHLKDFEEIDKKNELEAIRQLTENIRLELANFVPKTRGKIQEEFLIHAHKFYLTYYNANIDLFLHPKKSLHLRKNLSKGLHQLRENNLALYSCIEKELDLFYSILENEQLTAGLLTKKFLNKSPLLLLIGYGLRFLILLPFYIFGLINNYIAYIIPYYVFRLLKIDIEYKAPVQMIVGLFTFPIYYFLEVWLFRHLISTNTLHTILFLLSLPISGYISMYFWLIFKRFKRIIRFYFIIHPKVKSELIRQKDHLLERLEQAIHQVSKQS